jgi:hypothetical protein
VARDNVRLVGWRVGFKTRLELSRSLGRVSCGCYERSWLSNERRTINFHFNCL